MKKPLLFFLFVLAYSVSSAQDRHEAWLRVNLIHWQTPKKAIGVEMHQRMQSNYKSGDKNMFGYPLISLVRPWLYWKLHKNWTLSYSPLSYHRFTTLTNITGETDHYTELRSTLGIQQNIKLAALTNRNRAWYELRFIDVGGTAYQFATRIRIQNALIVPLWKFSPHQQLGYQVSNEFFWALQSGYVGFDHNRLYNALQWKINKQELNIGYQWSLHKNGSVLYDRRQLFINTSFEL